jgi:hypothetical protein
MAFLVTSALAIILIAISWGNDTALLVAAVSIALCVGGFGLYLARKATLRQNFPLYLLYAAAAGASLLSLRINAARETDLAFARPATIAVSAPDTALSLRDLFQTDFRTLKKFAWHGDMTVTDVLSGRVLTGRVLTNLYVDYRRGEKFYAFFLPRSGLPQLSYELSEALVDGNKLADIKIAKDTLAASNPGGIGLLAINGLKFSRIIYIYHEDDFSPDQTARLIALFARSGIQLYVRDHSCADGRSEEGRNGPPHPI